MKMRGKGEGEGGLRKRSEENDMNFQGGVGSTNREQVQHMI
jgi:hypothetical protein